MQTLLWITGWLLILLGMAEGSLVETRIAYYCPFECYCDMDGIRCTNLSLSEIGESLTGNVSYIYMSEAALPAVLTHREMGHIRGRNVKVLAILDSDVQDIEYGAFANISKHIGKVKMQNNNIVSLKEGMLLGFETVKELDLAKNMITYLKPGVFRELNILRSLVLSENRIHILENGAFKGLVLLTTLLLDNNRISIIHKDAFWGLWSLTMLSLAKNRIKRMDGNVFGGLSNLQMLLLNNNRLDRVPHVMFSDLERLQLLNLQSNSITQIEKGAFDGLLELTELRLEQNNLTNVPADNFRDLSSLNILSLSHNNLQVINPAWFRNLKNMRYLYLQENNITDFPVKILEMMTSLTALYLGNNNISQLNASGLLNRGLKQISLEGNPLHCDCTMKRIWAAFQIHIPNLKTTYLKEATNLPDSQVRCQTPKHFQGKSWNTLYDLECRNTSSEAKLLKIPKLHGMHSIN